MTGGLQSSAFARDVSTMLLPILVNEEIIEFDIVITSDTLNGDSGLLRIFWSFTTGSDYRLTITKKGKANLLGFPLKVNADNSFTLLSDGYYRFDIGVEPGDLINMSSSVEISKINDLQIQQIQIGA